MKGGVMEQVLWQTQFPLLTPPRRGKVRDVYDLGEHLLIVATDRVSAFDVVLPTAIPDKGKVLTQLSLFWFREMEEIIENHLVETDVEKYPAPLREVPESAAGQEHDRQEGKDGACRVRGERIPCGLRLEGLQRDGQHLRDDAPAKSCGVGETAGAHLHPEHKG